MGYIGNLVANIIALIAGAILAVIVGIFGSLSAYIPPQIASAYAWLFGFIHVGDGIIPTADLLLAMVVLFTVWKLKYAIKILLHTIFPFIPVIGKHVEIAGHDTKPGIK